MSNLNEVLHDCNGHTDSELRLDLVLTDREVIQELSRRREPSDRESYAQAALKVGVLAIRQASGVIDTQAIQEEGHRPGLTHHNSESGLAGKPCLLVKPKLLDHIFATFR